MMHYLKKSFFYESQKSHNYSDYLICEADCRKLRKEAMGGNCLQNESKFLRCPQNKGMSYEEISQELGISINIVKNQMSKALESMRVFFQIHDQII
ncbi:sigma-70 region 4 domain-containing protein [Flavobacterium sp. CSZ]|uniref:RNA polymerase sigma factor n=1 Tax=Flavobacterium sp. CSZ TaxID=2783791 RepID=UPI001E5247FA|nr:sigma-70 region 4 domain-containing protein [Flavobacterium sp. CSZ]